MINKNKYTKEYALLTISFFISFFLILCFEDIWIHIGAMSLMCLAAVYIVKMDILHPYCWFSGFFGLYSIGFPILIAIGVPSAIGYTSQTMLYHLIALFIFLITVSPINQYNIIKEDYNWLDKFGINLGHLNRLFFICLLVCVTIAVIIVSQTGYANKDDIYENGGFVLKTIFRMPLIISLLFSLLFISNYALNHIMIKKLMWITSICLLLITLFSGERDFLFRFLLMTLFCFIFIEKINLKQLIVVLLSFVILLPLSATFKYYFLSGDMSSELEEGLLYSLLSGEFESSARNLQQLINNTSMTEGVKGYSLLLTDLISVFDSSIDSSVKWFNETFYPDSRVQYGFSLVGEGFIIDGVNGIIIVFILAGLITRYLYRKAFTNLYWLVAYFYFITVNIYSIRADLGTIYAALFKQVWLIIILVIFLKKTSFRSNKKILVKK